MYLTHWLHARRNFFTNMQAAVSNIRTGLKFQLPKKYEGTLVGKIATFWKNLYIDYKEAALDVAASAKKQPGKSLFYVAGLGFLTCCSYLNPDELSYREEVISRQQEMMLIPVLIRNPVPGRELKFIELCYNEGRIRRFSLGVISFIWFADHDLTSGLYEAQCSYLKPQLFSYPSRILDIGFLGKWWKLSLLMKNCDINIDEFR